MISFCYSFLLTCFEFPTVPQGCPCPYKGHSQPQYLRDVHALVWLTHGLQSFRIVHCPSRSTFFQECIFSHVPNNIFFIWFPPEWLLVSLKHSRAMALGLLSWLWFWCTMKYSDQCQTQVERAVTNRFMAVHGLFPHLSQLLPLY